MILKEIREAVKKAATDAIRTFFESLGKQMRDHSLDPLPPKVEPHPDKPQRAYGEIE